MNLTLAQVPRGLHRGAVGAAHRAGRPLFGEGELRGGGAAAAGHGLRLLQEGRVPLAERPQDARPPRQSQGPRGMDELIVKFD